MPIIIEWTFSDGSKEIDRIPVSIWKGNEERVTKVFAKSKKVDSVLLDPYRETADIDEENNRFSLLSNAKSFEFLKRSNAPVRGQSGGGNPMQKSKK